jgi:hypothetical protein
MSNNKSKSSKVASVRMPTAEYEEMFDNAVENYMTITNYIPLIYFGSSISI